MIHCSQCKADILHGAPFVRYGAFAYCSNECLWQYSVIPKTHVWSDYAHAIDPESCDYDSMYADIEASETQLNRSVEAILAALHSAMRA